MVNKKIRGATSLVSDGISFKSQLEVVIYKELLQAGFNPKYEEQKFVIWEGIVISCVNERQPINI